MNKIIFRTTLALTMVALLTVCGCGKKADTSKPVSEVKAEAEKMDVSQLRDMAMKYKDAFDAKAKEIQAEGAKLKNVPVTEMTGAKAKEISAKVDELTKTANDLRERFQIYVDELKKKGGDISGLQI